MTDSLGALLEVLDERGAQERAPVHRELPRSPDGGEQARLLEALSHVLERLPRQAARGVERSEPIVHERPRQAFD